MNTNMNIRTDREVKEKASRIFSRLGMDMTTAVNVFLIQAIQYGGLPFEVRLEEPNETTYAALEAAERGDVEGPFESVEAMMEALDA